MEPSALGEALRRVLPPDRVIDAPTDLLSYSYDSSFYSHLQPRTPDAVVVARSTDDVARTLAFASEHSIPVTPRGAASGQTGGSLPVRGGIVLAMNALNRVLELDVDNLQVLAEPGVIHYRLNQYLAPHRLVFPPDPGSTRMATIGGMASTNAHGMRAMKYGPTGNWVLGMEVVLPDGRVITTGSINSKARQSSSGLELTKLFVGAEGILGVVTKLRLKVMPIPPARALVLAFFDRIEAAGEAVVATFKAGIMPSAVEILDGGAIKAVNLYRPSMNLPPAEAMLLFEVDGNPPGVVYDAETVRDTVRETATSVEWSNEPKRISELWEARSAIGAAVGAVRPGAFRAMCGEDLCVPISRVPETLKAIKEISAAHNVTTVTYGHIGGGGIHPAHLIDPFDADEVKRVLEVADAIHHLALEMGGTITGEHGIGIVRTPYMAEEHGEALEAMRQIKAALDPQGIMNPGKVLSTEAAGIMLPDPKMTFRPLLDAPADLPAAWADPG
ncbi:MAG: FAD-binding protein [Chloroflexi bacterium]|nr:FAD-binding protein [Chloroflexota bacterium]